MAKYKKLVNQVVGKIQKIAKPWFYKRKRYLRKTRKMVLRQGLSQTHFFSEHIQQRVTLNHTTGGYSAYIAPTLGSITQLASYQDLFEQYKILSIDLKYIPYQQPIEAFTLATYNAGNQPVNRSMYIAFDPNDNSLPTKAQMLEYKNLLVFSSQKSWSFRFYPRVFNNFDDTAFGTQSSSKDWVDIGNTALVHHGVKILVDDTFYRDPVTNIDFDIGDLIITLNFKCTAQH